MTAGNGRILDETRKRRRGGRVEASLPRDSRSGGASYPVKRPRILNPVKTTLDRTDMSVIYVKEEKPPAGREPIERSRKLRFQ
jgi:hypothetical protein